MHHEQLTLPKPGTHQQSLQRSQQGAIHTSTLSWMLLTRTGLLNILRIAMIPMNMMDSFLSQTQAAPVALGEVFVRIYRTGQAQRRSAS
jgi:hypothetical protein